MTEDSQDNEEGQEEEEDGDDGEDGDGEEEEDDEAEEAGSQGEDDQDQDQLQGGEEMDEDASHQLLLEDIDPSILPVDILNSTPRKDAASRPTALTNKNRAPIGSVNLQRSYEICKAVVEKSANRARVESQLVAPPAKQRKVATSAAATSNVVATSSIPPVPLPPGATLVVTPSPTPGGPKPLTFGPPRVAFSTPPAPRLALSSAGSSGVTLRTLQPSTPGTVRLRLPPTAVPISPQQLQILPRAPPQLIPVSRLAGLRPESSTCLTVASLRQAGPAPAATSSVVSAVSSAPSCVLTLAKGGVLPSQQYNSTMTNSLTISTTTTTTNTANSAQHTDQHPFPPSPQLLFPSSSSSGPLVLRYQTVSLPHPHALQVQAPTRLLQPLIALRPQATGLSPQMMIQQITKPCTPPPNPSPPVVSVIQSSSTLFSSSSPSSKRQVFYRTAARPQGAGGQQVVVQQSPPPSSSSNLPSPSISSSPVNSGQLVFTRPLPPIHTSSVKTVMKTTLVPRTPVSDAHIHSLLSAME